MRSVYAAPLPTGALLEHYRIDGGHVDCYAIELPWPITRADFIEAFYTTWLFKLERRILAWAVARPSTDAEARQLALGAIATFAAWHIEDRRANEILMCDFMRRTRSWFMTAAFVGPNGEATRLHFGSAVVPEVDARTGRARLGAVFRLLLGFHALYSRSLLAAAGARLRRGHRRRERNG